MADKRGYWGISIFTCAVLFVIVASVSYFGNWHWAYNLWFNYGWSSDKGNGPEALQQTVVYAVIAIVLVPAVRRFIKREFDKVHHSIHVHGTELQAHLHHIAEKSGLPKFEHTDAYKDHVADHQEP
jgi:hypothetical protein